MKRRLLLIPALVVAALAVAAPPNVLFLCMDDLKPELGCYGSTTAKTPHIDRLAARGTVFERHYVQQAVCGPSRASMFSGLRPDTTRVWDLQHTCREECPQAFTMQEYFKRNGYQTAGSGKVMHGFKNDDPASWSIPFVDPGMLPYAGGRVPALYQQYQSDAVHTIYQQLLASGTRGYGAQQKFMAARGAKPATECLDLPDAAYSDGAMTEWALSMLDRFAEDQQPFFLTLGYRKPHLPFVAPRKYWDLYERASMPLAPFRTQAKDSPDYAYQPGWELGGYSDVDLEQLARDDGQQRKLIHGYYACVSYVDAQIGKVLDKLDQTGQITNTIVLLWGDHGWHLGDHGIWCKHTTFEQATRSPLIVSAPGLPGGQRSAGPVESIDLFPTLCILAGLPVPRSLQGTSLATVLSHPDTRVKEFALSQYPDHQNHGLMGYSLRTEHHRLVAWVSDRVAHGERFELSTVDTFELYDYQQDPLETANLAGQTEYAPIATRLKARLAEHFEQRQAKPDLNPDESI